MRKEVVGRANEPRSEIRALDAFEAGLAEQAYRLRPPEELLDSLPDPLADPVPGMPRRPAINGWAMVVDHGDVRSNIPSATRLDELPRVIAAVSSQRDWRRSWQVLVDHLQCRLALRGPVGGRDENVDDQPVAVLHQRVLRKGEPGFPADSFAHQPCLGISRRLVRLVAPLLAAKVDGGWS